MKNNILIKKAHKTGKFSDNKIMVLFLQRDKYYFFIFML